MTDWIDVNDRLPEEGSTVIGIVNLSKNECTYSFLTFKDGKFLEARTGGLFNGSTPINVVTPVAYWQSIPTPPQ